MKRASITCTILILVTAMSNWLLSTDALFEYKLKLQNKYKPDKTWDFLIFDAKFALHADTPEAFIKRGVCLELKKDRIHILDNNLHKLNVFKKDGQFLRTVGIRGLGPGDIYYPSWFEFYGTNLFISNNNGIDVFDDSFAFVKRIRNFLLSYRFHIFKNKIYSNIPKTYQGRYPLFLRLDMEGTVEKEFTAEEYIDSNLKFDKRASILSIEDRIVVIPRNMNLVYIYDDSSQLQKKVKINYPFITEIQQWNNRETNEGKGQVFWFSNLFASAKTFEGTIYLLLQIPRLEIVAIDLEGNIREHFYNDSDFRFMRWSDFSMAHEGGKIVFYVMGYSEGEETKKDLSEFGVYRMIPGKGNQDFTYY